MKGYKEPSFQDRAAASGKAKSSALKNLAAAPKRDEAEQAVRIARQEVRDAKQEAKRAVARETKAEADRAEVERRDVAAQDAAKAAIPAPTEAERKAARDAKYAARKRRQA